MKKLMPLFALIIFLLPSDVHAQCGGVTSCTAVSANATDVQAALNSITLDGTTLTIPAGTVAWGTVGGSGVSAVTYNQVHSTTLIGSSHITCTGTPGQSNYTCSDDGGTTIIDHVNHSVNGDQPDLAIGTAAGKSFRLSGFTFVVDGQSVKSFNGGALSVAGSSQAVRVDHVHFNHIDAKAFITYGTWSGVFDHIIGEGTSGSGWTDSATGNGDADWTVPGNFGTSGSGWRYYESSIMKGFSNDGINGGRMAYRFNTQTSTVGTEPLQTHATGSRTDSRAMRAFEVYGNNFNSPNYVADTGMEITSSSGLVWGNTTVPTSQASCTTQPCGWKSFMRVVVNRTDNSTYAQTAPPNGWGYCGTSQTGSASVWDQNSAASTGHRCLDAPGTGAGDLLSGSFTNGTRKNTVTGTQAWPHQASEPIYEWMDTWVLPPNSGGFFWGGFSPVSIQNSDIYLWCNPASPSGCTSFNGTVGVGSGTLATRPSTCTKGVGYWATDVGNWNQSGNGFGQGELFLCTATNTWTLYYTPLIYPHPLISGQTSGAAPAPPTNVVISVQ
jgi:hypothetical protein